MIDPDGISVQTSNLPSIIKMGDIPPCEIECYCLEDDKDFKKYIDDIERAVRRSDEYKKFIAYLRNNMQMDRCAFLKDVTNSETTAIKIEIHHYPFSLHDISNIVVRKRQYYHESLEVQMVAKEVMELHYKFIVGLIPLSETVHKLTHNSRLFVPSDKVMGRYNLFVDYYRPFIDPDQLETLDRIEKYSEEKQSRILNTSIIEQNKISYQIKDPNYQLPDSSIVTTAMLEQINTIKANNYMLPSISEVAMLEDHTAERTVRPAISFNPSLIKK